jgi:hypothetical protein
VPRRRPGFENDHTKRVAPRPRANQLPFDRRLMTHIVTNRLGTGNIKPISHDLLQSLSHTCTIAQLQTQNIVTNAFCQGKEASERKNFTTTIDTGVCMCHILCMSERLYRTQLLLRPEQHRRLVLLSKDEGRSISEVARSLLDEALLAHQSTVWESRSHVIERLRIFRNLVRERRGAVEVDLITESRNERENERPWA